MSWDAAPVVITVAPTGAEVTRDHNPALPHTPEEIAADAIACANTGAAVVHLHVREPDGTPSSRVQLFRETIRLIREQSSIVTMVSTGGAVWMSVDERITGLDAAPDLAGVETGSLNFGDEAFVTTRPDALEIVRRATASGIGLEVEAFDVGHVTQAVRMLQRGELPAPMRINLVFGVPGGIDASPQALHAMLRPLPEDAYWSITAIGRHQRRMLGLAILHGSSGVRVGFEDNVYRAQGLLASSNAELVQDAADLVQVLGRRVASIAESRSLLGLD